MPRARKAGSGTSAKSASTPASGDPKARLIDAALDLAATKGWRTTGMGEIARAANVPLGEAYAIFPTRMAVIAGFGRRVNEAVLASAPDDGSAREKLFELIMRRFDALKPHRAALKSILRDSVGDPAALCGLPRFLNAMAWTLEAAGISAAGWRGPGRVLALSGAYGAAFRVFLGDDSDDLAKTMAELDKRLKSGIFSGDAASDADTASAN